MKDLRLVSTVLGTMIGFDVCLLVAYFTYRSYVRKITGGQHNSQRWRKTSKMTCSFLALSNFVLIISLALCLKDVEHSVRRICPHKANRAQCTEAIDSWRKVCCWLAIPVICCFSAVISSLARAQITLQRNPSRRYSPVKPTAATALLHLAFCLSMPLYFPDVFFRNTVGDAWIFLCLVLGFWMITIFMFGVCFWVEGLAYFFARPQNSTDGAPDARRRRDVREGEFILLQRVGPRTPDQ